MATTRAGAKKGLLLKKDFLSFSSVLSGCGGKSPTDA